MWITCYDSSDDAALLPVSCNQSELSIQLIIYPPSTTIAWPWTSEACVDAKNKAQSAISFTVPVLFISAISIAGLNSSTLSSLYIVIGVVMMPGQIQFTQISLSKSSIASALVTAMTAALDAEYAVVYALFIQKSAILLLWRPQRSRGNPHALSRLTIPNRLAILTVASLYPRLPTSWLLSALWSKTR